jgi:hypothetical protein
MSKYFASQLFEPTPAPRSDSRYFPFFEKSVAGINLQRQLPAVPAVTGL